MRKLTRLLLISGVIMGLLGILTIWQLQNLGKVRMVACNVGQGDSILLQSSKGSQVLIDGGPGSDVLNCLAKHMPFWDRKIEIIVNTHPQQDHLFGLVPVIERYQSDLVLENGLVGEIDVFDNWKELQKSKDLRVVVPKAGDRIVLDDLEIEVLWPDAQSQQFWQSLEPADLNDTAIVLKVKITDRADCMYLTGDAPFGLLEKVITEPCAVLKVAHHGSKTGTSAALMEIIKPSIAVIQVAKNNRYGHPNPEVLNLLNNIGANILRNDLDGDIEVVWEDREVVVRREIR